MKIGFIGAGLMGKPMIDKLLENNFSVNVFNRSVEKTKDLELKGAEIFTSPEDLVLSADVIIIMLTDYNAVIEVLSPIKTSVFEKKNFIQMGTLSPQENIYLNKYFESRGGNFFEAPVLGSIPQIKEKKLLTFIGAEKNQYDEYTKIFECFSNRIIYIGEVGKASALKLAINQLIISELAIFSMSLKYILHNEIDVEVFMDVLRNSALYAPAFDKKLNNFLSNDFSKPNFPLKHMLKDLKLIIEEFESSQIDTSILAKEKILLEYGINSGFAEEDYSAIFKCLINRETF